MKYNYYPKSVWNNSILEYCELPLNKPQYIKTIVNIVWNKCLKNKNNLFFNRIKLDDKIYEIIQGKNSVNYRYYLRFGITRAELRSHINLLKDNHVEM